MRLFLIIYFTVSITSIFRDFVDEQCDLNLKEALMMLFLIPFVLIYCVIEKVYNKLTSRIKEKN